LAPNGIKPAPSGFFCAKSTKNSIFAPCLRHLAESPLPPGGSSQKNPELG